MPARKAVPHMTARPAPGPAVIMALDDDEAARRTLLNALQRRLPWTTASASGPALIRRWRMLLRSSARAATLPTSSPPRGDGRRDRNSVPRPRPGPCVECTTPDCSRHCRDFSATAAIARASTLGESTTKPRARRPGDESFLATVSDILADWSAEYGRPQSRPDGRKRPHHRRDAWLSGHPGTLELPHRAASMPHPPTAVH